MSNDALLHLRDLRVENANAFSSPMTWGFPAITAFTGFVNALERRLAAPSIELGGCGIICHHYQIQAQRNGWFLRPSLRRATTTTRSKNPKTPPAIIEEGRIHLRLSLTIELHSDRHLDYDQLKQRIADLLPLLRLAGGVIHPEHSRILVASRDANGREQLLGLLRGGPSGFALISADDVLRQHYEKLTEHDPQADSFTAMLQLLRLSHHYDEQHKQWQLQPPPVPWLVPIPVGYAALSQVYNPGEVSQARNPNVRCQFVESLWSLGRWLSPYRLANLDQFFWRACPPTDRLYLCQTYSQEEQHG